MSPTLIHRTRLFLSVVLAAVLLGACSAGAGVSGAPTSTSSAPVASAPPSEATAFPVTVTDDEGTAVEIAAEPEAIVSLTPANSEILFALGAGDRIVATDDGTDYPPEAAALTDVATFDGVDVEAIVALEPDLVVAGGLGFTPPEAIEQLRSLGVPVLVIYAPSIDGVYHDIELIGEAVGATDEATALTGSMKADIDAIATAVADGSTPPRVFYEVSYVDGTGEIYGPAEDSFLAEMVTKAGADAIVADPVTYLIPIEQLIERDPELIVLGVNKFYEPTAEAVAARPGWDVMMAVREGEIRPIDDTEITRPGPRLPTGLRNLASAIRPDVALPSPAP